MQHFYATQRREIRQMHGGLSSLCHICSGQGLPPLKPSWSAQLSAKIWDMEGVWAVPEGQSCKAVFSHRILCLSSWVDVAHQRGSDLKSQFIQAVVVSLPHLISGKLAVFLKLKPFCYISLKWISGLQGTEDRTDFICLFCFCFAVSSDV